MTASDLRREQALFICAVQFLTRLPTPRLDPFDPDWITRSARYFPLVGQLVGGLSALVLMAAATVWPVTVAVLLALATGLMLTGAFHEDGLADSFDGLWGGLTPERRLEIMKDSRVGTYGLLALVTVLLLKLATLATMPAATAALLLLAAHGTARAAAVVVMAVTPYAPLAQSGKWKPLPQGVRPGEVAVALLIALWPLLFLPSAALAGLLAGAVCAAAIAVCALRRIGGHTGDVLGAVEQLFEAGFLLAATAALG